MNVYGGLSGDISERGRRKERILLRGQADESVLHMYIWRQHNETHQTLFERGDEEKGMEE
jgi:hypothetical protein